jgi:hypothetical protein
LIEALHQISCGYYGLSAHRSWHEIDSLTFMVDKHNSALNEDSKRDTDAELGKRECNLACRNEYYFGFKLYVPKCV